MRARPGPRPANLRHRIAPNPAGGFDLVTSYGYLLYHHEDRKIVAAYYAWHCTSE